MGTSDLMNLVGTIAMLYFAWQQNQIFRQQNAIFASQGGQAAGMPSETARFLWIKRYWPTFFIIAMILLTMILLTCFDVYDRHRHRPEDTSKFTDIDKLERVQSRVFKNETVVLGGKYFLPPTFDGVFI